MDPHYHHKVIHHLCSLLFWMTAFLPFSFSQVSIEWERTYGGDGWEELQAMTQCDDGGYLFGGLSVTRTPGFEVSQPSFDTLPEVPGNTGDFYIVKTDGDGNMIWNKRYGGHRSDRIWSLKQTSDGGYILAGESASGKEGNREHENRGGWSGGFDYWLIKIDALGTIEWQKVYGGAGNDHLRVVIPLPDGYFLGGFSDSNAGLEKTENSMGGEDYWVLKVDLDGNVIWENTIGGDEQERLFDAVKTPDGGFILGGYSVSGIAGDKTQAALGVNDIWLVKIDDTGNIKWQQITGGTGEDVLQSISATRDGHYMVCGQSSSNPGPFKTSQNFGNVDAFIVKIEDQDTIGVTLWDRSFGGSSSDYGYSFAQNNLGFYMVAGLSFSVGGTGNKVDSLYGSQDYWILWLDPSGNKIWDQTLGGINPDACSRIMRGHEYGFVFGGHSLSDASPPFKSENSRGLNDMWVIRTSCSFPPPNLEDVPKVCKDESIEVDATVSPCDYCIYQWNDGSYDPKRSFKPDTTTEIKITIYHPDGCELSDSIILEIVPGPDALSSETVPVTCFNDADGEIFIQAVEGGFPPYKYSMNGGDYTDVYYYPNLKAGLYKLKIEDVNGCKFDTVFYLEQPEEILVELGDDIYIDFGDSVQLQALTNLVDSTYTFTWGQPTLLSCTDCLVPWVQPFVTTTYSITIKDSMDCRAHDLVRVILDKEDAVYVPNVFSPNNDNINDFFTIYADRSIRQINKLLIFDRWGEKMWEQHDFQPNIDQSGWDGRLDGQFLNPAVFVWFAEIEFVDGRVELFKGDVTLMR